MAADVRRNDERTRYELFVDDELVAIAEFVVEGDTMVFPHTEVNPTLRGQGLGEQLVRGALDDARGRGLHVVGQCWFVRDFIDAHPEYAKRKAG